MTPTRADEAAAERRERWVRRGEHPSANTGSSSAVARPSVVTVALNRRVASFTLDTSMRALPFIALVAGCTAGGGAQAVAPPSPVPVASSRAGEAAVAVAIAVASSSVAIPVASSPVAIAAPRVAERVSDAAGIAYAPASLSASPRLVVYFHGMWASAEDSCSYFERGVERLGILVCPRGNAAAAQGGAWTGSLGARRASYDRLVELVTPLAPTKTLRRDGGVLVGFSSGARMALDLALAEPDRWSGLVLMSMALTLDAKQLGGAGVRRLVLGAGELDGTYTGLVASAKRLEKEGVLVRFVSLGKVGHHFAVDMDEKMRAAFEWVVEGAP